MIETQAELRDAQEKVKDLQGKLHNLESQRVQMVVQHEDQKSCEDGPLDKLQDQVPELFDIYIYIYICICVCMCNLRPPS